MEGFTFATALDLNMGYYHIRLDPDSQKICTIIFPWGKYLGLELRRNSGSGPSSGVFGPGVAGIIFLGIALFRTF
jgi:hypothetical protein